MGVNYFCSLGVEPCPCCGHQPETELHIGKSSNGWAFSLHVIPEREINSLGDWKKLWAKPGVVIRDEYDQTLSVERMLDVITNRGGDHSRGWGSTLVARHVVDREHCIGRGEGPWDLIQGEFC